MRPPKKKLLMLYMVFIGLALEYLREELLLKLLDTPFSGALCNHLWYALEVFLFFTEWMILERRQVSAAFKKGIRVWGLPVAMGALVIAATELSFWNRMTSFGRVVVGISCAVLVFTAFPAIYAQLTEKSQLAKCTQSSGPEEEKENTMRTRHPILLFGISWVVISLSVHYLREELVLQLIDSPFSNTLCDDLWYALETVLLFFEIYILMKGFAFAAFKKGVRVWGLPVAMGALVIAATELSFWNRMTSFGRVVVGLSCAVLVFTAFPAIYAQLVEKRATDNMPPEQP